VNFFFDNCLPPRTAKALQALDDQNKIVHLRERYPTDIKDPVWIPELAREGNWIIVSIDQIHKVPIQREALLKGGFIFFLLKKGWNQPLWIQASRFFAGWPGITVQAARARPGDGFRIPSKGQEMEPFRI
jgi:hypothetical protein